MPQYNAFLIRCWRLVNGETRFIVEQLHSSERQVLPSFCAATAWIKDHLADQRAEPPDAPPPNHDPPDPPPRAASPRETPCSGTTAQR